MLLSTATFIVRPAGRARVLRDGHKNVHAFVCGYMTGTKGAFGIDANTKRDLPVRITYNPFRSGHFEADGSHVKAARAVLLNERGMTACYVDYYR